jgi:uncharacterized protein
MPPISDLNFLLESMEPHLQDGTYVYVLSEGCLNIDDRRVIASIRETEGLSLIVEKSYAQQNGLDTHFECAWITLNVNSDLAAVGLTAAFATALGKSGISCNVVAGLNHDHIFVPVHQAYVALEVLRALQQSAYHSAEAQRRDA